LFSPKYGPPCKIYVLGCLEKLAFKNNLDKEPLECYKSICNWAMTSTEEKGLLFQRATYIPQGMESKIDIFGNTYISKLVTKEISSFCIGNTIEWYGSTSSIGLGVAHLNGITSKIKPNVFIIVNLKNL
jgi:hypothetical protein